MGGPVTASSGWVNLGLDHGTKPIPQPRCICQGTLGRKVERFKTEMYFLRGEKKTVEPPPMIFYWTWQIGCSVSMDTRQSLSTSANQAERSAQDLPSKKKKNQINILIFLLRFFKRLAAPPCFAHSHSAFVRRPLLP